MRRPIDHNPQVQLACNVATLLDKHLPNDPPLRSRLRRHQRLPEQAARHARRLICRSNKLHAALLRVRLDRSLSPSSGVNLRFDDGQFAAQIAKSRRRLFGASRHDRSRHRHAGLPQDLLRLKLVDLHAASSRQ
jgi:hypothetical protein